MDTMSMINKFAAYALPVLFAITAHEAAHAYVAMLLGDKTAYREGRVSLNPKTHIDPIGTVLIPAICLLAGGFLFGWAKPVPVQVSNLRYGRKSFVWVALAGPFSNMIMGILWALIALAGNHGLGGAMFSEAMAAMGMAGISINLSLLIFNLLPIPPLDGSRVVLRFLKGKARDTWESMEQYGMFIILGLSLMGVLGFWFKPWMGVFSWIPAIAYF